MWRRWLAVAGHKVQEIELQHLFTLWGCTLLPIGQNIADPLWGILDNACFSSTDNWIWSWHSLLTRGALSSNSNVDLCSIDSKTVCNFWGSSINVGFSSKDDAFSDGEERLSAQTKVLCPQCGWNSTNVSQFNPINSVNGNCNILHYDDVKEEQSGLSLKWVDTFGVDSIHYRKS